MVGKICLLSKGEICSILNSIKNLYLGCKIINIDLVFFLFFVIII